MDLLVTGATGYVGGRLVPELLKGGHHVKVLTRSADKLDARVWRNDVEVVEGDAGDIDTVAKASEGVDAAYYLVHSMSAGASRQFQQRDAKMADNFAQGIGKAEAGRIIYLGGLGDDGDPNLSKHLRSRHEVGRILASGQVPVTELRAAVIIGAGSASFEMLRNLVQNLPVMVTPRWVRTLCQPIAIQDVLFYLREVLALESTRSRVFEIGGPEVISYRRMMDVYSASAGLRKRIILPVPLLTPSLSSQWIGLTTPLPTALAKPLVHGLANEVVIKDHAVDSVMPHECITIEEAIALSIQRTRDLEVTTSWADAELPWRSPADPMPADPEWSGGTVLEDARTATSSVARVEDVFEVITRIGGQRGWLATDWMWQMRGWIDKLVGGVGMRRGRRNPNHLRVGDAVDFWRVERLVPNRQLRLRAEMRLPGKAWLEWNVGDPGGKTELRQLARFEPRGLAGRLYWLVLRPFHGVIFKGLSHAIMNKAEGRDPYWTDNA